MPVLRGKKYLGGINYDVPGVGGIVEDQMYMTSSYFEDLELDPELDRAGWTCSDGGDDNGKD